jgi:hypothetical protein
LVQVGGMNPVNGEYWFNIKAEENFETVEIKDYNHFSGYKVPPLFNFDIFANEDQWTREVYQPYYYNLTHYDLRYVNVVQNTAANSQHTHAWFTWLPEYLRLKGPESSNTLNISQPWYDNLENIVPNYNLPPEERTKVSNEGVGRLREWETSSMELDYDRYNVGVYIRDITNNWVQKNYGNFKSNLIGIGEYPTREVCYDWAAVYIQPCIKDTSNYIKKQIRFSRNPDERYANEYNGGFYPDRSPTTRKKMLQMINQNYGQYYFQNCAEVQVPVYFQLPYCKEGSRREKVVSPRYLRSFKLKYSCAIPD